MVSKTKRKNKDGKSRNSELQLKPEALNERDRHSDTEEITDQAETTSSSISNFVVGDVSLLDNEFEVLSDTFDQNIQSNSQIKIINLNST